MSARRKSTAPITPANKTQRNPLNNFNIKNETLRNEAKGTKPTCEAASVKDVLVMALLHICKKTIFFDVRLKVALYLASLFLISLIGGEFNQPIDQVDLLSHFVFRFQPLPEVLLLAFGQSLQRVLRQNRMVLDFTLLVALSLFHKLYSVLRRSPEVPQASRAKAGHCHLLLVWVDKSLQCH